MIGARRAERRQRLQVARIDELQHFRRVGEMADLAFARRDAPADRRQELRRDVAALVGGKRSNRFAAEGCALAVGREPGRGLVDHGERRLVAGLRGRAPGEEPVAAEHDALQMRVRLRHRAEFQAEIEARSLPGQEAHLVAIDRAGQRFGVLAGGDRDHRVGMHVVDMRMRR